MYKGRREVVSGEFMIYDFGKRVFKFNKCVYKEI